MTPAALGSAGAASAPQAASTGAFGNLKSDEFIRIMMAELSNQDPFKPQDSGALLEQLSSLRNIESQLGLQQRLESLVLQNQVTSASGMIGKQVAGVDAYNDAVSGMVASVKVEDGKAVLQLADGRSLAMSRVTEIRQGAGSSE